MNANSGRERCIQNATPVYNASIVSIYILYRLVRLTVQLTYNMAALSPARAICHQLVTTLSPTTANSPGTGNDDERWQMKEKVVASLPGNGQMETYHCGTSIGRLCQLFSIQSAWKKTGDVYN